MGQRRFIRRRLPTFSLPFCDTLKRIFYEEQCIGGFWVFEDMHSETESQDSSCRAAEQPREFLKSKVIGGRVTLLEAM